MCLIRDLALALSACLYQALCSSDAWSLHQQQQDEQRGAVGPLARLAVVFRAMHNIIPADSGKSKRDEAHLNATSAPAKWPGKYLPLFFSEFVLHYYLHLGVTSLRALLAREKDEDAPRLLTLLCEAFVAVYTSLLCYAMAACDSHVLFRYFILGLYFKKISCNAKRVFALQFVGSSTVRCNVGINIRRRH